MAMVAVGEPDSLMRLPDMYMRKMAVGPAARDRIDLGKPVAENIEAIADTFGRRPNDITAIVLDRPRHHDLIEEIRAAGARIKLIQDGDVTASISAAIRGTNDHLAIGIGGTRQAILSAAALRCLGGGLQAQLWPTARSEIEAAREYGIEDVTRVFGLDDFTRGDVIVVATASLPGTCCAASASSPIRRGHTHSSCALGAIGCGSWTGSTSSRASGARKSACSGSDTRR